MYFEKSITCAHPGGTHEIIYSEFPGDEFRTVICLHGLSRNGRDFDWLAESLANEGFRVICPDMAGRGRSPAFADHTWYNYPQYVSDMITLINELKIMQCDWIGTSMGGLIGMMLAMQPESVIQRLVFNDVGPFISAAAMERIKKYVSMNPSFPDWDSFYAAFRQRMKPFGLKNEAEEKFLAEISMQKLPDGNLRLNYDTNIIAWMGGGQPILDMDLWSLWPLVKQKMLILHGADSDILGFDTLQRMMIDKQATSVSFAGVGHAPALLGEDQISVVKNWLLTA
ncbi:MAG: hypothetical protein JWM96_620 [Alphaproteobacteria bacterium]|nr:hypothetical protein [Alphaproteobacteria bacterium]